MEKEGSLSSLLGQPSISQKGQKRPREEDDDSGDDDSGDDDDDNGDAPQRNPEDYVGLRVAKYFEAEDGSGKKKLFFGKIDYVSLLDAADVFWHVSHQLSCIFFWFFPSPNKSLLTFLFLSSGNIR